MGNCLGLTGGSNEDIEKKNTGKPISLNNKSPNISPVKGKTVPP